MSRTKANFDIVEHPFKWCFTRRRGQFAASQTFGYGVFPDRPDGRFTQRSLVRRCDDSMNPRNE